MEKFDNYDQRLAWAKSNPSFCTFPYSDISIRRDIDDCTSTNPTYIYSTCCCNLDTSKFSVKSFNDNMNQLKNSMEKGVLPDACWKCKKEEEENGQSERIRNILSIQKHDLIPIYENKKSQNFAIQIKFSNFCNLACRTCNATDSTTFGRVTKEDTYYNLSQDLSESNEYWQLITDIIKEKVNNYVSDGRNFFFLSLIGGETLLSPGALKLLDWLVDNNIAHKINLRMTTAISVNPSDKWLQQLNQFAQVDLGLSIDSVGENYHYVRWPAKFSKIENNLTSIINFIKEHDNGKFDYHLTPVFSLNNIFYIDDYLDYWYKWFKDNRVLRVHSCSLVDGTKQLDVQALPIKYRPILKRLLEKCLTHPMLVEYPEQTIVLYGTIKSTIDELNNSIVDDRLWKHFLYYTAQFDVRTKTQFAIFNERLYNLLDDDDKKSFDVELQKVDATTQIYYKKNRNFIYYVKPTINKQNQLT